MIGIARDVGGSRHFRADDDALAVAAMRKGGRVKNRAAGDDFFRLFDVGDDDLLRLPRARAQTGQREGRAHELQETAATEAFVMLVPFAGMLGKFAVQEGEELGAVRPFLQAAPEARAAPVELDGGRKRQRLHGVSDGRRSSR